MLGSEKEFVVTKDMAWPRAWRRIPMIRAKCDTTQLFRCPFSYYIYSANQKYKCLMPVLKAHYHKTKTHATAEDCWGAAKNRKISNFLHHTCLLQLHVNLQQILGPSECAFRLNCDLTCTLIFFA